VSKEEVEGAMKSLVVYESMFGNSEQVARAIAEGLEAFGPVTVRDVATAFAGAIPHGVDLLVVGGPTHAFSMSRRSTREDAIRQGAGQGLAARGLREWIEGVNPDLKGLPFVTFDTRVSRVRRLPGSAGRSAARHLRRHHGRMIAPPESFFVNDVPGPLDVHELDRARTWARQVADALDGHPVETR
jgi:flavodoxin